MPTFSLEKWYLDVVGPDGSLCIAYAARLSYGMLGIDYASLLACDPDGQVRTRTSLRRLEPPHEESGTVTWSAAEEALGFAGTWRARDPAIVETLLDGEEGRVTWTCHAPRADVEARLDGQRLVGLGYAEHLALSVPPWRLPIRTLRWGRALAEDEALVWIDWRGDTHTTSLAWRAGGARLSGLTVDEHAVRGEDGRPVVLFRDNHVLRHGAIGSTALSVLGKELLGRVPGNALMLDEKKWRARADFDGGSSGWAIHEVVGWP